MSRLDDFKSKYPEINWDLYSQVDFSKTKKYLGFIANAAKENANPEEIKDLLIKFEKLSPSLQEKDINKYSFSSLKESLKDKKSIKDKKQEGAELIGNVFGYNLYLLKTAEAAKYYSAGTKWCISNKKTFNSYLFNYNLIVVAIKEQHAKMALLFKGDKLSQIYSENDVSWTKKSFNDHPLAINNLLLDFEKTCSSKTLSFKEDLSKIVSKIKKSPESNLDYLVENNLQFWFIENNYYSLFKYNYYSPENIRSNMPNFLKSKKIIKLYNAICKDKKKYKAFFIGSMKHFHSEFQRLEKDRKCKERAEKAALKAKIAREKEIEKNKQEKILSDKKQLLQLIKSDKSLLKELKESLKGI